MSQSARKIAGHPRLFRDRLPEINRKTKSHRPPLSFAIHISTRYEDFALSPTRFHLAIPEDYRRELSYRPEVLTSAGELR